MAVTGRPMFTNQPLAEEPGVRAAAGVGRHLIALALVGHQRDCPGGVMLDEVAGRQRARAPAPGLPSNRELQPERTKGREGPTFFQLPPGGAHESSCCSSPPFSSISGKGKSNCTQPCSSA